MQLTWQFWQNEPKGGDQEFRYARVCRKPTRTSLLEGRAYRDMTASPIKTFKGSVMGYVSTMMRIKSAFEGAGIRFLEDAGTVGLQLQKMAPRHEGGLRNKAERSVDP